MSKNMLFCVCVFVSACVQQSIGTNETGTLLVESCPAVNEARRRRKHAVHSADDTFCLAKERSGWASSGGASLEGHRKREPLGCWKCSGIGMQGERPIDL